MVLFRFIFYSFIDELSIGLFGNMLLLYIYLSRSKTSFDGSNSSDGKKGFERELQELFDEVKMMIATGNKNDAADLLRANYEAVKERMNAGARSMEEAALIDVIALGYIALGDLKFVGSLLGMVSYFLRYCILCS